MHCYHSVQSYQVLLTLEQYYLLRKKPHIIIYLNLQEEEGGEEADADHSHDTLKGGVNTVSQQNSLNIRKWLNPPLVTCRNLLMSKEHLGEDKLKCSN